MYVLANSTFSVFPSSSPYLISLVVVLAFFVMAAFPFRNAFVIAYRRLCLSPTLSQKSHGYRLYHSSFRSLSCQLLIRGSRITDNLVLLINSQVLNSDLLSREIAHTR